MIKSIKFVQINLLILFFLLGIGNVFAQQPKPKIKVRVDTIPTALILIDIQDFYFPGGRVPLVNPEAASEKAAALLKLFRSQGLEVIHVQHGGGTPIHKNVTPLPGEKLITKRDANSFNGTDLQNYLTTMKIKRLVICGMQTQMCVEGTTRAAYDLGYKCIVVEDACATRNLMYGRRTVFAIDVQASTLATLDGYYATIVTTADLE
ncbi:MAG: cysteine hydrolase family protein [Bacteroidetes bacterium]|nr:cysteine hydrolase family protein [Bacteroidota bacterium]